MPTSRGRFRLWAVGTCLLGFWYLLLAVTLPSAFNYDAFSEAVITDSIAESVRDGVWSRGGFMSFPSEDTSSKRVTYYSQYGLHYQVYAVATRLWPADPKSLQRGIKVVVAGLLSATLMWIVLSARRDFGPVAGWTTYVLLFVSYPLVLFAVSLYWLPFLILLPFAFTLSCYGRLRGRRLPLFYLTVCSLVFAKSLCGFEYLSCISLSVAVGVVYHELIAGSRWSMLSRRAVAAFVAGCVGFALAFAATYLQARAYLGDDAAALESITRSARMRTMGDTRGNPISWASDARTFCSYFFLHGQAFLLAAAVGGYCLVRRLFPDQTTGRIRLQNFWIVMLTMSFVTSVSWNIATPGHMRYHTHLNFICFFIPFNLILYIMIGWLLQLLWQSRRGGRSESDAVYTCEM
jgi:hypothetical protein